MGIAFPARRRSQMTRKFFNLLCKNVSEGLELEDYETGQIVKFFRVYLSEEKQHMLGFKRGILRMDGYRGRRRKRTLMKAAAMTSYVSLD